MSCKNLFCNFNRFDTSRETGNFTFDYFVNEVIFCLDHVLGSKEQICFICYACIVDSAILSNACTIGNESGECIKCSGTVGSTCAEIDTSRFRINTPVDDTEDGVNFCLPEILLFLISTWGAMFSCMLTVT